MQHLRPELPYGINDLSPYISSETLEFHAWKHHQAYVDNLNKLIEGTEFENADLETIIQTSTGGVFNNAAQTWNHTFYFENLTKPDTTKPGEATMSNIEAIWWDIDSFKAEFSKIALGTFGSGWAWLVIDESGSMKIRSTSNAMAPITQGETPLLTCDVWEHAYYIDTKNARAKYIENFWHVVDWNKVESRLQEYFTEEESE